ncbi:MAG: class B sortase [Clostridiales bacterium]|nr:class B sortase [Clostridiales bacterium]
MKKWQIIVIIIACAAAAFCAVMGIRGWLRQKNAGKGYEDLREEVVTEVSAAEPDAAAVEETESQETVEIPIDFDALWEENPDIYAWIVVPGTSIDYPILRRDDDDSYYLSHGVDGEEAVEGAIYTESYNSMDFTDPNTVVYGHNMKNGSMFRTLHNFEDKDFFDENRDVTIYLPDEILHYRIFAAYVTDNLHILLNNDFSDPDAYQSYLDNIFAMDSSSAFVDTDMEVSAEDKILTLSTCNAGISTQRYLVQAVLVSIEQ